jgi:hypothetical protein
MFTLKKSQGLNNWIIKNGNQLSIISHKKRKKKSKEERDHQPEEVAAEFRSNFICPTRKFCAQNKEYKYPTILYSLGMSDNREDRERREISRVSPCDYIFFWQVEPTWQPLISSFNSLNLAYPFNLTPERKH